MRLFLDANVLFAAAHSPRGRCDAIFRLARHRSASLLASHHVLQEARRNLALKSPHAESLFREHQEQLQLVGEADPRLVAWAADLGLPANDAPVLAAAVAAGADVLVTGDRTHFGSLYGSTQGSVRVLTPRDALAILLDLATDRSP